MPRQTPLSDAEVRQIRAIGDNSGCMALKGGSPDHDGPERADAWPLGGELREVAQRWDIEPERDLRHTHASPAPA